LGHKARVNGPARTTNSTPRVIAPQNRMRLTRSPRHLSQPKTTATSHSDMRQPQVNASNGLPKPTHQYGKPKIRATLSL